ncbi:putative A kinase anchor protein, partial [Diplonema papillatum]
MHQVLSASCVWVHPASLTHPAPVVRALAKRLVQTTARWSKTGEGSAGGRHPPSGRTGAIPRLSKRETLLTRVNERYGPVLERQQAFRAGCPDDSVFIEWEMAFSICVVKTPCLDSTAG